MLDNMDVLAAPLGIELKSETEQILKFRSTAEYYVRLGLRLLSEYATAFELDPDSWSGDLPLRFWSYLDAARHRYQSLLDFLPGIPIRQLELRRARNDVDPQAIARLRQAVSEIERRFAVIQSTDDTLSSAAVSGESGLTWRDLERTAKDVVQALGFSDAELTRGGADSGIDVISRRAAAQVKAWNKPVGRPAIQQLVGAANGRIPIFFTNDNGYTHHALQAADELGVALFVLNQSRHIPVNRSARQLTSTAAP